MTSRRPDAEHMSTNYCTQVAYCNVSSLKSHSQVRFNDSHLHLLTVAFSVWCLRLVKEHKALTGGVFSSKGRSPRSRAVWGPGEGAGSHLPSPPASGSGRTQLPGSVQGWGAPEKVRLSAFWRFRNHQFRPQYTTYLSYTWFSATVLNHVGPGSLQEPEAGHLLTSPHYDHWCLVMLYNGSMVRR